MLTLQQLNALRGISANASKSATKTDNNIKSAQPKNAPDSVSIPSPVTTEPQQQQPQNNYVSPIEIPCKNYADEQGHFAYIDANTHQTSHVNLDSGEVYTIEDVYRLSLAHSVKTLSATYHRLTWQQVMSNETLYDRFGSPVFSFEEIQTAYDKYIKPTISSGTENVNNPLKTDPFGFPL
ncbi:MAG: hypothetical protein II830_01810 [Alphaproteobacteria bacterium]|nr:hypothetical protein [Alphaproteobacteria bacterium]